MREADRTTLWARALVGSLVSAGLREVVVAPGSRSTPLVLAAARRPELTLRVQIDERSAGFLALGIGKASGRPAAVITTSGTAVANLLPAVVEASRSDVPLLLLTADRPPRLRGTDANQTIDQHRIFGGYPRAFHEPGLPDASPEGLERATRLGSAAVSEALGLPAGPPGPVHLNLAFEKPLEPEAGSEERLAALWPSGAAAEGPGEPERAGRPDPSLPAGLVERVLRAERGVIVAGPRGVPSPGLTEALLAVARRTGWPVLADPLSGARWPGAEGEGVAICGAYDLHLGDVAVRGALEPDFVLRVGPAPTSTALLRWLERWRAVEQVVIDDGSRTPDHAGTASQVLRWPAPGAVERVLRDLAERLPERLPEGRPEAGWTARWAGLDRAVTEAVERSEAWSGAHEGALAAALVDALPDGSTLFVSSSMPVRDVDAFGRPDRGRATASAAGSARPARALRVLGNRGASGIDGIVSTALGVALGSRGSPAASTNAHDSAGRPAAPAPPAPVVALVGDLALLHDQNGLLRAGDAPVLFVVVHNDGGGIFHQLPVRVHEPAFETFFGTPHGLELRHVAALHGLPYREVDLRGAAAAEPAAPPADVLREELDALAEGGSRIVVLRTDRDEVERLRKRVRETAVRAARRVLRLAGGDTSSPEDEAGSDRPDENRTARSEGR